MWYNVITAGVIINKDLIHSFLQERLIFGLRPTVLKYFDRDRGETLRFGGGGGHD